MKMDLYCRVQWMRISTKGWRCVLMGHSDFAWTVNTYLEKRLLSRDTCGYLVTRLFSFPIMSWSCLHQDLSWWTIYKGSCFLKARCPLVIEETGFRILGEKDDICKRDSLICELATLWKLCLQTWDLKRVCGFSYTMYMCIGGKFGINLMLVS
uniref:Uncharacterized protein n=1 Tax=Mus musculus TaxID=10090 RepID=Q9D7G1_MOUSE|nr:unnamed protein product [Mus musculus]